MYPLFPGAQFSLNIAEHSGLPGDGGIPAVAFPSCPLHAISIAVQGELQQTLPSSVLRMFQCLLSTAGQHSGEICHGLGHLIAIRSMQFWTFFMLVAWQQTLFLLSLFMAHLPMASPELWVHFSFTFHLHVSSALQATLLKLSHLYTLVTPW